MKKHKNYEKVIDKSIGCTWMESRPTFNVFNEDVEFVLVTEDNDVNRNICRGLIHINS